MAAKDVDDSKEEEQAEGAGPMLDMSQAAVKKMIAAAKAKGFITYEELNRVLPPEQVSSEQIEDVIGIDASEAVMISAPSARAISKPRSISSSENESSKL